ncbi:MAG: PepSY domain-containing protein [Pirellulales bacterium]
MSREELRDRHWIDQAVAVGIAAHEGQLFGWPNQLLGLLTALGLVLLSVSGVVMRWRRREPGTLGRLPQRAAPRVSWLLLAIVLLLAVYIPLFGRARWPSCSSRNSSCRSRRSPATLTMVEFPMRRP